MERFHAYFLHSVECCLLPLALFALLAMRSPRRFLLIRKTQSCAMPSAPFSLTCCAKIADSAVALVEVARIPGLNW